MSQHSFSIANEAGAAFRADVNSALQALASQSSGTSEPATKYAYQVWADTTASLVKRRNAANSAWLVIASLSETYVVSRSSNTILGLSDYGKTFISTSTFTQTLTAAATLGDGWHCFYRNDGTGVITIDPNSSELIDGSTILVLFPGEGCRISCNGSAFSTQGLSSQKKININTTAVGNVGAGPDDLMTYSLQANSLSINGKGVRVTAWGTTAANGNAKRLDFFFGSGLLAITLTTTGGSFLWRIDALIIRTGSNAQDTFLTVTETSGASLSAGKQLQNKNTMTETDSSAIAIKCQAVTATADNDIVQEGMLIELLT